MKLFAHTRQIRALLLAEEGTILRKWLSIDRSEVIAAATLGSLPAFLEKNTRPECTSYRIPLHCQFLSFKTFREVSLLASTPVAPTFIPADLAEI